MTVWVAVIFLVVQMPGGRTGTEEMRSRNTFETQQQCIESATSAAAARVLAGGVLGFEAHCERATAS